MPQSASDVLLVGSVPLDSAREVFQTCASALGSHLKALPDGEVGARKSWIQCQAKLVFDGHPALETVTRPKSSDGLAGDYNDNWSFTLKPGASAVDFEDLHYARWAKESYEVFRQMRKRGEIPAGLRFQVSLPTPAGGSLSFSQRGQGSRNHIPGQEAAMLREAAKICTRFRIMISPCNGMFAWRCSRLRQIFHCSKVTPGRGRPGSSIESSRLYRRT